MTDSSNKFYSLFFSVFFLFAGFGLFLNSAGVKLAQMGVSNTAIGALNAAFFVGAALSAVAAHRVVSGVGRVAGGVGLLLLQPADDCGELVCRAQHGGGAGAGAGFLQCGLLCGLHRGHCAFEPEAFEQ